MVLGTILIVMYFKKRLSHRNVLKDVLLILVVSATQEEYVIIIIIIFDYILFIEVKCMCRANTYAFSFGCFFFYNFKSCI